MKNRWEKIVSVVSAAALLASIVPTLHLAAEEPAIPDVSSWKYVTVMDFEAKDPGSSASTWGGYGTMLADTVVAGKGAKESKGLKVYNLSTATGEKTYAQPYYAEGAKGDFTGAEELWFWIDMRGYANAEKTNFSLRPRLLDDVKGTETNRDLYLKSGSAYYLQSGTGWVTKNCNESATANAKCAIKGVDIKDYVGYVRIPLSSFGGTLPAKFVGGYIGYMVYDFQFKVNDDFEVQENSFIMDDFLIAGANMTSTDAKTVKSLMAPPVVEATGYSYKFVQNYNDMTVGTSQENWDKYCTNVSDMVTAGAGADGTQGLVVASTADKATSAYCQPFYCWGKEDNFAGATELWVWLDMSSYGKATNVKIRPRLFCGSTQFDPTMKSGGVYYLQNGQGWTASRFNTTEDPTAESTIPGADLTGFKGYIRLPLSSFHKAPTGDITKVFGAYVIFDFNFKVNENFEFVANSFTVDNILMAGSAMTGGAAITTLFDGSLAPDPTEPTAAMKAAAAAAKDAIAALPAADKLTLEDADKVAAARALYDKVDVLAISLVDNLRTLVAAEEKIKTLQEQAVADAADKAAAQTVIDLITALKAPADITTADLAAVKAAKAAFDGLTVKQQALVTNKEKLENATKQAALLENRRPEDPDPSWKYLSVVNFENLEDGYNFASEEDGNGFKYMFGPQDNKGKYYESVITKKGFQNSKAFTFRGVAGNVKGQYAQPLLRLDQLVGSQFKNYTGAEEMVMYVDFTHIKLDSVGMQLRFMENDMKDDGTLSGSITQWGLKEGAFVYMLDANGNWKKVCNTDSKYESAQNKLPVEITGRVKIAADPESDLFRNGLEEVKGYKGFIRIPLSQFEVIENSPNANNKMDLMQVTQLWMVFNYPADQDGASFTMDEIGFAGHFTVAQQGEVPVLNYLPMSSGKTDTPAKPDDGKKEPTPNTGNMAAAGAATLFGCSAWIIWYQVRRKKNQLD